MPLVPLAWLVAAAALAPPRAEALSGTASVRVAAAPAPTPSKPRGVARSKAPPAADAGTAVPLSAIHVQAQKLNLEERQRRMVYTGNVRATRGDTKLFCDRLVAFYSKTREVTRVECTGAVQVFDGDRWAKGERAEFDNVSGVLEMTGEPEVKQGTSHMKGTKITFYVGTESLEVQNPTTVFESVDTLKTGKKAGGGR